MIRQAGKGSVTVWLSLILLVLMSVMAAVLYSARGAACRVALASGVEQGLYSLFAQYDRDLYERFGLLLIDGGYGSAELRLGTLLRETEEDILRVIRPVVYGAPGSDILHMDLTGGSVTGYLLATDQGAAAFRHQVCEAAMAGTGDSGTPDYPGGPESARDMADYLLNLRAGFSAEGEEPASGEETEVPEGFVNPLDAVRFLQGQELLFLVLPDQGRVSDAAVPEQDLMSRRVLNRGMGLVPSTAGSAGEQAALLAYLTEMFSCFTDESSGEGLQYQIEYAVGRHCTDRENLQEALQKLFVIREASNMVYLMSSPSRQEEASRMAAIIAAVMLQPELQPAAAFALKTAWAYGESILDLRTLLNGGRIPMMKDDSTWQLPLNALAGIGTDAPSGSGCAEGLSYPEYLQILLADENSSSLTAALMDLTEHLMRTERHRPHFRLDNCLEAVELEFEAEAGRQRYHIERRYAYDPGMFG